MFMRTVSATSIIFIIIRQDFLRFRIKGLDFILFSKQYMI